MLIITWMEGPWVPRLRAIGDFVMLCDGALGRDDEPVRSRAEVCECTVQELGILPPDNLGGQICLFFTNSCQGLRELDAVMRRLQPQAPGARAKALFVHNYALPHAACAWRRHHRRLAASDADGAAVCSFASACARQLTAHLRSEVLGLYVGLLREAGVDSAFQQVTLGVEAATEDTLEGSEQALTPACWA